MNVKNSGPHYPRQVYLLAQFPLYVKKLLLIGHLLGVALLSPTSLVIYLVLAFLAMPANSSASNQGKGPPPPAASCIFQAFYFPLGIKCYRVSKSDYAEQAVFVMGYIKNLTKLKKEFSNILVFLLKYI